MGNPADILNRVMVVGATGMLGCEVMDVLARELGDDGAGRLFGCDERELDITSAGAVLDRVRDFEPSVVINVAALTDVDGCEARVDEALAVNAKGPENLARACREVRAFLVHLSTDYVFGGRGERPYREEDQANPQSVYGRSKWEGECGVRANGVQHIIVRTSWLFGRYGRNFVEAILARAGAGRPLTVVDDQVGRPTSAVDLAEALLRLLKLGVVGTIHCANEGFCSWYDFAVEIVAQSGSGATVERMRTADLNRSAPRPAYSVLDTTRYGTATGETMPDWRNALGRYLSQRSTASVSTRSGTAKGGRL